MSDPNDFEQADFDGGDDTFEAGLRAAFGPPSTAMYQPSARDALEVLRRTAGVSSHVMLRDEPPSAPLVAVPAEPAELAAASRGRYQVLGEIARGGMGVVLKGRDPNLGRDVALKTLQPAYARRPDMIRRFVEEAQIGGQLQHPGILPIYEFGLDDDLRPFFTMRLVHGRNLATLLDERPAVHHDRGRFLAIFEQVCQTVAYAHARGVIHRDLKPSNVLVGAFGEVQTVDWGLAKVIAREHEPHSESETMADGADPQIDMLRSSSAEAPSETGSILGTPAYMSPEQARGDVADLDERTDVFALGAILCEILTGQPPYVGDRAQVLQNAADGRLDEAITRLSAASADPELIALARRSLAADRSARPRHAGVVAREIAAHLASARERAQAAEIAAAEARAAAAVERRTRRRTTLMAAALCLAVAAAGVLATHSQRQRRARAEQSIAEVAMMYRKGAWFREEASRVPVDQLPRWQEALALVRRTAEIIGAGATDQEMRDSIAQLVAELKAEDARIQDRLNEE